MKYISAYIDKLSEEKDFIRSNVEKVIRLLDVLDFIFVKSSCDILPPLKEVGASCAMIPTDQA